jgi:hypothetical protein
MAREHGRRGHDGAELQHRQAAEAHEAHEAPQKAHFTAVTLTKIIGIFATGS